LNPRRKGAVEHAIGLPEAPRVRMRTINGLKRLNKELKRRTCDATLFPNPESCQRSVIALLA
jgi:putative transposase